MYAQSNALFGLFMFGVVCLFAGATTLCWDNKRLGYLFFAVGALHMLPAIMKLWMTVVFG